jgi:activator of HSP90 ATPase
MDSRKHARFTQAKARISRKVGGKICAFDGHVDGTNLELVPDKKIVQSWRGSDWPKGHYSRATFLLKKAKSGTRLVFTQSGVPEDQYHPISQGWRDYYWGPIKAFLKK